LGALALSRPALVVIGGLLVYPVYRLGLISFLEYTQAQVSGGEPNSALALVLLEVVWCSFPFVMVTVYAGIRAVPGEVLEAAALDGASQWRIWRSVPAPMLRLILVVVTIQLVIWDFKVFTQIYVMTNGGGIAVRTSC
jgi:ABC-type sugar transport system permease subunit